MQILGSEEFAGPHARAAWAAKTVEEIAAAPEVAFVAAMAVEEEGEEVMFEHAELLKYIVRYIKGNIFEPLHIGCAREAGVNAGESPAGAIRRFSTEDRANCVAARRGGEQARSRTCRSQ